MQKEVDEFEIVLQELAEEKAFSITTKYRNALDKIIEMQDGNFCQITK